MLKVKVIVTQSCLTLCNPMDCSLQGSSVHGILQPTILEWVAIYFSGDLTDPVDTTAMGSHRNHTCDKGFLMAPSPE